jgi:allantoinase
MAELDLVICGGTVVTADGERLADLGVADGQIVAVEVGLRDQARETIDATGLHIFPGLIDSHVHFNEPGRTDWEGIETGSQALAAGGGTLFFDMPLNAHPPTLDSASFDEKIGLAAEKSYTDFALWGGLVPSNLHCLEQLAERGVIGFKAFMSNSGIEDFSSVDEATLREGMKRAAKLGKLVAVHAESEVITSELSKRAQDKGPDFHPRLSGFAPDLRGAGCDPQGHPTRGRDEVRVAHRACEFRSGRGVGGERAEAGCGCDV